MITSYETPPPPYSTYWFTSQLFIIHRVSRILVSYWLKVYYVKSVNTQILRLFQTGATSEGAHAWGGFSIANVFWEREYLTKLDVSRIELCAGAGAPAYFAGAGKLRQKLRQTKLWKIISYFNEHLALNGKIKLLFTNILLYITMWFTINSVVKRFLKKINSEITLKYFRLLPLLNMEFP
jgi:hypothetical protein